MNAVILSEAKDLTREAWITLLNERELAQLVPGSSLRLE